MRLKLKALLLCATLLLFMGCSTTIDKNKIIGSWHFVLYTDRPYSESELYDSEKQSKSQFGKMLTQDFNYIFKSDGTYEYLIYGNYSEKGTYSITQDEQIILFDKIESKNDTMKVKYLDDKFLQIKTSSSETERIAIFYKNEEKFPETEVIKTEQAH